MILLVGQVPRGVPRSRGVPGARLRPVFGGIAKWAWRSRRAERVPDDRRARVRDRALRPPGAGRAGAARGHARRGDRGRRRRPPVASSAGAATRRTSRACASCSRRRSGRSCVVGEGGWTQETGGRRRRVLRGERAAGRRARSAARTTWTTARPAYVGRSRRRLDEALAARLGTPTSCSRSGAVSARSRPDATRFSSRRAPRQTLVHVHPDPDELGFVYEPDVAIESGVAEFAAALARARAAEPRWAELARRGTGRLRGEPRSRGDGGAGRPRRGHGVPASPASRRRGPDLRRGQLHRLGAPLRRVPAVRDAGVPAQRLDGLRRRGGDRGEARAPRPDRALLHRRRRLRDELAGVRDRGAVRPPDRRAAREQRDVRDDPHAPGAPVPGPRHRHRPREPGLRRLSRRRTAATASGSSATEDFEAAFERALASGKPALLELPVDPERISPRCKLSELRAGAG